MNSIDITKLMVMLEKEPLNIIDIRNSCSYLICENSIYQEKIEKNFGIVFENGVANMGRSFLRKEIINNAISGRDVLSISVSLFFLWNKKRLCICTVWLRRRYSTADASLCRRQHFCSPSVRWVRIHLI